jgi:hypothetical protein
MLQKMEVRIWFIAPFVSISSFICWIILFIFVICRWSLS